MEPTWSPPGSCWPHVGPMLAPWTLLSGMWHTTQALRSFLEMGCHLTSNIILNSYYKMLPALSDHICYFLSFYKLSFQTHFCWWCHHNTLQNGHTKNLTNGITMVPWIEHTQQTASHINRLMYQCQSVGCHLMCHTTYSMQHATPGKSMFSGNEISTDKRKHMQPEW